MQNYTTYYNNIDHFQLMFGVSPRFIFNKVFEDKKNFNVFLADNHIQIHAETNSFFSSTMIIWMENLRQNSYSSGAKSKSRRLKT